MTTARCPICDKRFELEQSESQPFCSRRCQQIDLGRWLGEQYGLPYESLEDDEREPDEEQR